MIAQSSAVHAIGTIWSRLNAAGATPARDTKPYVGFNPAIPHNAAGPRIEPPVSVPIPHRMTPAATAAPVPLLDPAVKCSGFHGLCAGGFGRSNDGPPSANSCVVSLPISTVPAAASRAAH